MIHCCPISPLTTLGGDSQSKPISVGDLAEEELDPKSVVVDDPIVGEGITTLDEHGPGALEPRTIPAPSEMTSLERSRHFANGHLPYDPRCEICLRCKRPNTPHSKSNESERTIPLLVGDFAFAKDGEDEGNATILVLKLYPYKLIFSCLVSGKGYDPLVVARLCRFIMESGLVHFAYRSDKEPAIVSLIQEACAMAGRNGVNIRAVEDEAPEPEVERAHIAVPEHSHPGESQSNGLAERTIREVVDEIRTLKASLEMRVKGRLANDHPVMAWMVEHAAYLLNRCKLGTDGRTAYGRLHGKESLARLCEFGERILWFVPKKHRAKLDAKWRYGVFLGRATNCDQNFIGLADGTIVTARAIARLVPSLRWSHDKLGAIKGVPMDFKTASYDVIEEADDPHAHPSADAPADAEDPDAASRRLRITDNHLRQHGYTNGCRRCDLHKQGQHSRAKHMRHDEVCRSRIYLAVKEARGNQGEEEDKRLESRLPKKHEPKPIEPETPRDLPMEVEDVEPNDLPDIGGEVEPMDRDDTTDFFREVDEAMEEPVGEDHEMIAMMDVLQTLGVEPDDANRFSAKIMRISNQPMNPTFVEMYGCGNIVTAANTVLRNLNVHGLAAFDLRTSKPSGVPWDFSKKSDRTEALKYVKERKPTWIVGSPPCTAFSRLQGLNFPKMDPARVAQIMKEARAHLHFVISLYHIQIAEGRHFLHEHPQGASSWKDPRMLRLLGNRIVNVAVADQCMYGLVTKGLHGEEVPAKKPTQWASTSPQMLKRLSTRCDGSHPHQHLIGGRAAAAAYYPAKLITQILRGMRDTADAAHTESEWTPEMSVAMIHAALHHDQPATSLVAAYRESDLAHANAQRKVVFNYMDGREISLSLDSNFKPQYKDEYTSEWLPHEATKDAMLDELSYFCQVVFKGVSSEEAMADPEGKIIGCRWVNCNKGDLENPDVRCRLVGQEVNHGDGPTDAFYAATPPLEAKRLLFSQWATEQKRGGKHLKISCVDIRKAYFNGVPKRSMYVRLPPELGLPRNVLGKLVRCMYGTRDAGAIWEQCYVDCLEGLGFKQGLGSPCCFYHQEWQVSVVVHGDDFTALGTDDSLDKYEAGLKKSFECKIRGRLGSEAKDTKEIRLLNRIIRITEKGLLYEADPRHAELLAKSMGLEQSRSVATPGTKRPFSDEVMDLPISEDDATIATMDVDQREPRVKFSNDTPEVMHVTPYSEIYKIHPSKFVFSKEGARITLDLLDDPSTGVATKEVRARRKKYAFRSGKRSAILHKVLVDGPAWEPNTADVVMKVSKKGFKAKRVGSKAAKALEFESKGEILTQSEATLFRALAARANYLAMDRPECAYATKELCRFFATPTKTGVEQLKRLIRYLASAPRLVWHFGIHTSADPSELNVFVDTDFAGCHITRRSTSGGAACRGNHLIKHWSTTQATVALSSAEAELTGICKGAAQGLGLQTIASDLGINLNLSVLTDATAAIGICRRRGLGKVRHLATADLWVQDRIRKGDFKLSKVPGAENPADMLTKHVDKPLLLKHCNALGLSYESGRAESAPAIP